jgi:hypothetical protein
MESPIDEDHRIISRKLEFDDTDTNATVITDQPMSITLSQKHQMMKSYETEEGKMDSSPSRNPSRRLLLESEV